ncbi:MAG TPA: SDR family NAD(P)-dependent oxidoreductase [Solirubrobacterales bacterium]|nr:SDR family NAD(P)-dependent oxidoreductase [Solirubrobacterales bacterium]
MAADPGAVLITGCSSGIGEETARRFARRGWTVYATARRPESIQPLADAGCKTLALDVTDEDSMRSAVAAVEDAEGAVGALVNNAGYSQSGALETLPMERLRAQFETNVFGLVRMCQLVLPGMRRAGRGRIVNLSSMGGRLTFPGGGAYHGSKYAVEALSDALRWEVQGFGIHVVIVEPGLIVTSFGDTAAGSIAADSPAEDGSDPYARFNATVGAATKGIYEGPMRLLGGGPDAVARVIERAITSRKPRPRYKVTASARLAIAQRRLLGDRAWDAVLRTQFTPPGRSH